MERGVPDAPLLFMTSAAAVLGTSHGGYSSHIE
jgi:hypothetical protein